MTKEELIEMIDATINENGSRGITGKALNLALTEIVNAMGSGSGGGAITFYAGELTEEQQAANVVSYNIVAAAGDSGLPLPSCTVEQSAGAALPASGSWASVFVSYAPEGSDNANALGVSGICVMDLLSLLGGSNPKAFKPDGTYVEVQTGVSASALNI